MAESAVSFLLNQLSVRLREGPQLLGGLETEVGFIRDEMEHMMEFLRAADGKEEDNSELKEWNNQLREISCDVEDVLDRCALPCLRDGSATGLLGYARKTWKSSKAQGELRSEMLAIKRRLELVSKDGQEYRAMFLKDQGSYSGNRMKLWYAGYDHASMRGGEDIVGVKTAEEDLHRWIRSESGCVFAVVGIEGSGKTTLVRRVYDDESVRRSFQRHVWIVASDYSDVKYLMVDLVKKLVWEVKDSPPDRLEDMTVDQMSEFIHDFLKGKKCIFVFDDVREISTLKAITRIRSINGGCTIMITVHPHGVTQAGSNEINEVYHLRPLPDRESEALFTNRSFIDDGSKYYFKRFLNNILHRCNGLPLAIDMIGARLCYNYTRDNEWEKLNQSLIHEPKGENLENLWRLFSLIYNELPHYLKHCFLYLSISAGGGLLEKGRTIRLWIAEGFVQSKRGDTMEDVAVSFLNELCSRHLIQGAEKNVDGSARAFRIHSLLQDYVMSKSREQNIVTVYSGGGGMQWPNKIRRLAMRESIDFSLETHNFECLRSLLLLCDGKFEVSSSIKKLLSRCRLLKVLELRGAGLRTIPDAVFELYYLKYLSLRNTTVNLIDKSIKHLVNLETLVLKNSDVTELPIEILELHKLRHLLVYKYRNLFSVSFDSIQSFKAPWKIGSNFRSLQKLFSIEAEEIDGVKIVREIGRLTQLTRLGIAKLRSKDGKELCDSIAMLTSLRSLRIDSIEEGEKLDLDYPLPSPSLAFLRTLYLCGYLEKVPQWITSLKRLTTLHLVWSRLGEDPLESLQDLPKLTSLTVHNACVEELSFKARGFAKLKELLVADCKCLKRVKVENGSIPLLQKWIMRGCKLLRETPQGMEHLTHLQVVEFVNMADGFVG